MGQTSFLFFGLQTGLAELWCLFRAIVWLEITFYSKAIQEDWFVPITSSIIGKNISTLQKQPTIFLKITNGYHKYLWDLWWWNDGSLGISLGDEKTNYYESGPSYPKQELETDILFSFSSFALPACLIPCPLAMSRSVIAWWAVRGHELHVHLVFRGILVWRAQAEPIRWLRLLIMPCAC